MDHAKRAEELRAMVAAATPGPWYQAEESGPPRFWVVTNLETWVERVCPVPDYDWDGEKRGIDNARLIAAAPTLATELADLHDEVARLREVKIKPLVWVEVEGQPCTRFSAPALGGEMNIVELDPGLFSANFDIGGLTFRFVLAQHDDGYGGTYSAPAQWQTVEAAKAAAQADYEARIRSAIVEARK